MAYLPTDRQTDRLQEGYSSIKMCDECDARKPARYSPPELVYTDLFENAGWRATIKTHDWYVETGNLKNPFQAIPGSPQAALELPSSSLYAQYGMPGDVEGGATVVLALEETTQVLVH